MVQEIKSAGEFQAVLSGAGGKLVVVDFTATWCGPCQRIAPVFEELAETYKGKVIFIKVDVDQVPDVSAACGIESMPTFQFYRDGNKVSEFSGASPDTLRAKVAELQ